MATKQERLIVLGQLSSVLAHEIRNPLAGISAATQMLDGRMDQADPSKKYTGMILKEIERVNQIVQNLLDFSRDRRACLAPSSLHDLTERALVRFAAGFERFGIRVRTLYSDKVPPVMCDADQICHVFSHLIANALDAMPGGGTLTVRTSCDAPAQQVTIAFEDTGVGVSIENLGELFSPFYTTKTKGSGLGLPVALKVVEDHGGTIVAQRGVLAGLTMTVRLPVNRGDG